MKKIKYLIIFLLTVSSIIGQTKNEVFQYTLKLDSSILFVDNSKHNWYTLEFKTDSLQKIKGNMFFFNGKPIQIGSLYFDSKKISIMGSAKAEKLALKEHKTWELTYQKNALRKNLRSGNEFYYGKNEKPFLIWWFKTPQNCDVPKGDIEISNSISNGVEGSGDKDFVKKATYQLFLDFVIDGGTIVVISLPVLEDETLSGEINKLKTIANSLNVYGNYIDLGVLKRRLKDKEKYFVRDSMNLVEVEIPDWMNIIKSPFNFFIATFPEKDNIVNACSMVWEYKSDSTSFQSFIKKRQLKNSDRENVRILEKDAKIQREIYSRKDTWFLCQDVYMEGDHVFCFINFTATTTTYDFNVERFNELIQKIHFK